MKNSIDAPARDPHGEHARSLAGYEALRKGVALVDHPRRTVLRLAGKDPTGMLNAILTNEVPKEANLGVYAALLNPKGRIQTDLRVLKSGDDVLIDTELEGVGAARDILGRYAPFSRVKLEDLSESWSVLGLYGPRAGELLGGLQLAEHETAAAEVGGVTLLAAGVVAPVPGFDLLGPADVLRGVRDHLLQTGAVSASPDAYETARIEAGIPRFGVDISTENFPGESESFLERAVSFQKGCYPGQETVARMRYRGQPNKKLYRFELEENPAEPGCDILQGEERLIGQNSTTGVVGWISSVAPIAVGGRTLALGYLARKADPNAPMQAADTAILVLRPV